MKTILCFLLVTLFAIPAAFGQQPAPKKTDSTFIAESGDLNVAKSAGQTISFTIKIDRVVAETDSDGGLPSANISQLFGNKIIKDQVTLTISAYDVDRDYAEFRNCTPREFDRVKVNGYNIGTDNAEVFLDGTDKQWRKVSFQVPTQFIKFGKWMCDGNGENCSWQGEGINMIEITVSTAAPNPYQCGSTTVNWDTKVSWGAIKVKALYPVVMIHGYDSNNGFWTKHDFAGPFKEQKILFDASIALPNKGKGSVLTDSDSVKNSVSAIAAQFHVKHIHLVAHSKGGLIVRNYVANSPPGIAILSVTTLSTMHHGTVIADFSLDFDEVTWLGAAFSGVDVVSGLVLFFISAKVARTDEALKFMRVSYVEKTFNPGNKLPDKMSVDDEETNVSYFSFGADANLNKNFTGGQPPFGDPVNGSAIIEPNEVAGSAFEGKTLGNLAAGRSYDLLYKYATTHVKYIKVPILNKRIPTTVSFDKVLEVERPDNTINDFFVTVQSTRYTQSFAGATFLTQPLENRNHQLIADPDIARKVITKIKSAQ